MDALREVEHLEAEQIRENQQLENERVRLIYDADRESQHRRQEEAVRRYENRFVTRQIQNEYTSGAQYNLIDEPLPIINRGILHFNNYFITIYYRTFYTSSFCI